MDLPEVTTSDAEVIDRKELLAQQFDDLESADPPAERVRSADGKFAPTDPVEAVEPPLWSRPPKSWIKEHHEDCWGKDFEMMIGRYTANKELEPMFIYLEELFKN